MNRIIQAGKFKAQCLKIMDNIKITGKEIIVTKHHVPIVKLTPIVTKDVSLFGKMAGTVHIKKDILSPIDEEWDADH